MLKQRIDILEGANMISKEVSDYSKKVVDYLASVSNFEQSKLEMFITHLAMGTQRIVDGEPVNELDVAIIDEVRNDQHYNDASKMYIDLTKDAPVSFPDSEKDFIIMHLCNLLQQETTE